MDENFPWSMKKGVFAMTTIEIIETLQEIRKNGLDKENSAHRRALREASLALEEEHLFLGAITYLQEELRTQEKKFQAFRNVTGLALPLC